MLGVEMEAAATAASLMKQQRLVSSAMTRTSDWVFSQEIPSDISVQVGEATFNLHKFPLMAKSGYIRKLLSGANGAKVTHLEIPGIPGDAEAFELVTKFCYGLDFDITVENIAMLRCASEYLEMTEEYTIGNLISRTEAYLDECALMNLAGAVTVLHKSEELLPVSEEVKLISRCIDAIAYITSSDNQLSMSLGTASSHDSLSTSSALPPKAIVDWWAEELTVLRIDTFQRVVIAMKARGFKGIAIGPLIMLYAQKSLRSLDIYGRGRKKIDPREEHDKRVVLETIVSLLPRERNTISVSFLSMLLRAAIYLETTVACRLDLEKRMAVQLEQAVLDDLLIPSVTSNGETSFDVDTVHRILVSYLEYETEGARLDYNTDDDFISSPPRDVGQVGRLTESYLAEIASDQNLTIKKFVGLAGLIPERARYNEDGMYRAIDIYLKAHPSLGDTERKKVCSIMDCQKLSREACAHAAQNDRLPAQTVVQVLYFEQHRLRDTAPSASVMSIESPTISCRASPSLAGRSYHKVPDEVSRLQRENDELKLELLKLRMRVREPSTVNIPSSEKPPLPKKSFINTVSKKLSRLNLFSRSDTTNPGKTRTKPPKNRRHSIS